MRKAQNHLVFMAIFLTALVSFIYGCNTPANSNEEKKIELNKEIIKWTYPIKGNISSATLKGEKIYFEVNDLIYIVSTQGRLMKIIDPGTKIYTPILVTENELFIAKSGKLGPDRVIIFNKSGEIKGRLIPKYNTDNFDKILYKNKTVFCLLNPSDRLVAMEIDSNGTPTIKKWEKKGILSPVQLSTNGVIYAIKKEEIPRSRDVDLKLAAIDTNSGQIKYKCYLPDLTGGDFVVDNEGNIIMRTLTSVYKLDKHCHMQWKYTINYPDNVYPTSDTVYFTGDYSFKKYTLTRSLIAIDSKTGKEKWVIPIGNYHENFMVKNGKIYLIASKRHLYIIDTQGNLKWDVVIKTGDPLYYESIIGIDNGTVYLQMRIDTWTDGLFAISIPK